MRQRLTQMENLLARLVMPGSTLGARNIFDGITLKHFRPTRGAPKGAAPVPGE